MVLPLVLALVLPLILAAVLLRRLLLALIAAGGPAVLVALILGTLLGTQFLGVVGHLHQFAAVGVGGHLHDQAGPDEAGLGQPGAVRLHPVLVEAVDLLVAAAAVQVPFGDLPQGVVVPADRRLDAVELRLPGLGGVAQRGRLMHLTGPLAVGSGQYDRIRAAPAHDMCTGTVHLCGHLARPLLAGEELVLVMVCEWGCGRSGVAEAGQARRKAGRAGAQQQDRGDELPGQQLVGASPGSRRQAHAGKLLGLDLDQHAGGELAAQANTTTVRRR